jgi:hypothetical protein
MVISSTNEQIQNTPLLLLIVGYRAFYFMIMTAKQRREQREKQIALNAWYSCMIAIGSVPANEDLYFETKKRFLKKHRIPKNTKIKTSCDNDYQDIKDRYYSLNDL